MRRHPRSTSNGPRLAQRALAAGRESSRIRIRLLIAFLVAFVFFSTSSAIAAPRTILTVGQVSQHPTATWSLPVGVEAKVVEVATDPATGSDGYFFFENVKAFDVPQPTDTAWTYTYRTRPGHLLRACRWIRHDLRVLPSPRVLQHPHAGYTRAAASTSAATSTTCHGHSTRHQRRDRRREGADHAHLEPAGGRDRCRAPSRERPGRRFGRLLYDREPG